jgi:hypothetical protein
VVDEENLPLSGLLVYAYDVDIGPDDFLGCAWTDKNGKYFISYNPSKYHFTAENRDLKSVLKSLSIIEKSMSILDRDQDIIVKVHDKLGVFELKQTEEHPDVKELVKEIKDTVLPRSWVEGWNVTLNNKEPSHRSDDNLFEPLVDNEKVLKKNN